MPISNWPKEDQPREKLLQQGPQRLTDAELIAIFLKTGTRGKTALDLAKELLMEYGGWKKLLGTPLNTLVKKMGIGRAKYATLCAALELAKRYSQAPLPIRCVLNSSQATQNFLAGRMRDYANEVFACLFLDMHLRLLSYEELFQGTINEANIYPREIVRRGLAHNAARVILAHNHPSGRPMPSSADKEVTSLIQQALRLVDIEVVDHIIIGNPENFSFAEQGLL